MIRDRFVRNARHLTLHHLLGQFELGCEMQVRKQQLILTHPRIFRSDRLFDLDDHVAFAPRIVSCLEQLRTGFHVLVVRKTRTFARCFLHEKLMARVNKRVHPRRREPYAVFIIFDLLGKTDLHK